MNNFVPAGISGIEVYDNAISKENCDKLISLFEEDTRKTFGSVSNSVENFSAKKSLDLHISGIDSSFNDYNKIIIPSLINCLNIFVETYKEAQMMSPFEITPRYNIQKYKDGEGYYAWHCEHSGVYPRRVLAWMFYLNDATCGTEFYGYNYTMQPKTGRAAIWSAAWTHVHKGVTPNIGDKYIATGWCQFSELNQ